jgi:hypothetical protein
LRKRRRIFAVARHFEKSAETDLRTAGFDPDESPKPPKERPTR